MVELFIVIAMISILAAILLPCLNRARSMARSAACKSNLRNLGIGLLGYASGNSQRLPPFAFSDFSKDLAVSSHWGGFSQAGDPAAFGRGGMECVNLWALVKEGYAWPGLLLCPAAPGEIVRLDASYFPYTSRFSTYSLRFPDSRDLFRDAPHLANLGGDLLGVYSSQCGGERTNIGRFHETVPQVRLDWSYRQAGTNKFYDPAADAILCDTFWRSGYKAPPGGKGSLRNYAVRWERCHREDYNVLYGCGAVRSVRDDGTIAANSSSPEHSVPREEVNGAFQNVWQYLDEKQP